MTRNLLFAVLAITACVAGCRSTSERIALQEAEDVANCKSFGASPGTDAMVNCRLALRQERQVQAIRETAGWAALARASR